MAETTPYNINDTTATVEICKILASLWYDACTPFNNQADAYRLVCKVTRELLGYTEDTYTRAIIERDATEALCQHYKV